MIKDRDKNLLKKIIKSGIKSAITLKKRFYSKPIFDEKYIKTKIKSFGDGDTDFHHKTLVKKALIMFICWYY